MLIGGLSFKVSQPATHYDPCRYFAFNLCRVSINVNHDLWEKGGVATKNKGRISIRYVARWIFPPCHIFIPGWNGVVQQSLINRVLTEHWLGVRGVGGFSIDGAATSIGWGPHGQRFRSHLCIAG